MNFMRTLGRWRPTTPTFQANVLRIMVGLIAIALPSIVVLLTDTPLSSISAAYHHDQARDEFVGLLFFVAAFLAGYNGTLNTAVEAPIAKLAALCAVLIALYPTSPDFGSAPTSTVHTGAAIVFFLCLLFFCLSFAYGAYLECSHRMIFYIACAAGIAIGLALGSYASLQSESERVAQRTVYWAEWIAMTSFSGAWLLAGVHHPLFAALNRHGWMKHPNIDRRRIPFWESNQ